MGDDERRKLPRVMVTVSGVLLAAVITMVIVQTGGSATTDGSEQSPRTVVATFTPETPAAPVVDQAAEIPVRLDSAPQVQTQTDLRRIVYTVAGNQRPDDPVTIVYADENGALQTARNVTLPWTLAVTPVVPVNYLWADSRGSQLNCWITDAGGSTVASQTQFSPSVTCNR